ncbi:MAG: hypothetical protein HYS07_07390 [Chlamydiae bacterium]|nr:hypothetical protein [Chlamydiota bacterium]MBI3276658.1 hypothetical protein [Chlamydiota bacterium]
MPEGRDLKDVKEVISSMKELHSNIKDMVEIFAKLPSGTHQDVSGNLELTTKEKEVLKLIQSEQERADRVVEILTEALKIE